MYCYKQVQKLYLRLDKLYTIQVSLKATRSPYLEVCKAELKHYLNGLYVNYIIWINFQKYIQYISRYRNVIWDLLELYTIQVSLKATRNPYLGVCKAVPRHYLTWLYVNDIIQTNFQKYIPYKSRYKKRYLRPTRIVHNSGVVKGNEEPLFGSM